MMGGGMPPMGGDPNMMGGMPQDPSQMGGDPSMMGGDPSQMGGMPQDPSQMGADPNAMGGMTQDPSQMGGQQPNQFDNNFDAGVEADEDEDPENYIRQLAGKLAQKIRSFNGENGDKPDESLNKYAAKMVIKAAADGMSPESRTELKKAVNTAKGNEDDETAEDEPSDGASGNGGDEEPQPNDMPQQLAEHFFTKRNLAEALKNLSDSLESKDKKDKSERLANRKPKKLKPSIYSGPKTR